jgi:hypothetical protein
LVLAKLAPLADRQLPRRPAARLHCGRRSVGVVMGSAVPTANMGSVRKGSLELLAGHRGSALASTFKSPTESFSPDGEFWSALPAMAAALPGGSIEAAAMHSPNGSPARHATAISAWRRPARR